MSRVISELSERGRGREKPPPSAPMTKRRWGAVSHGGGDRQHSGKEVAVLRRSLQAGGPKPPPSRSVSSRTGHLHPAGRSWRPPDGCRTSRPPQRFSAGRMMRTGRCCIGSSPCRSWSWFPPFVHYLQATGDRERCQRDVRHTESVRERMSRGRRSRISERRS